MKLVCVACTVVMTNVNPDIIVVIFLIWYDVMQLKKYLKAF